MNGRPMELAAWIVGGAGAWFVWSALSGGRPAADLRAVLAGTARPERTPLHSPAVPNPTVADTGRAAPTDVRQLVTIPGHPGHTLVPAAAAAFTRWERAYGRAIPITGASRTWQAQADGHARDPRRFVAPERSWHVKGLAVDVNLPALGAPDPSPAYTALLEAAIATGWCASARNTRRGAREPWHFSFGGCG